MFFESTDIHEYIFIFKILIKFLFLLINAVYKIDLKFLVILNSHTVISIIKLEKWFKFNMFYYICFIHVSYIIIIGLYVEKCIYLRHNICH